MERECRVMRQCLVMAQISGVSEGREIVIESSYGLSTGKSYC